MGIFYHWTKLPQLTSFLTCSAISQIPPKAREQVPITAIRNPPIDQTSQINHTIPFALNDPSGKSHINPRSLAMVKVNAQSVVFEMWYKCCVRSDGGRTLCKNCVLCCIMYDVTL